MNGYGGQYGQPPSAWQEHRTPDGRPYYYHAASKTTQWTKPEEMMTPAEVGLIDTTNSSPEHFTNCDVCPARPVEAALEGIHGRRRAEILV
jgi:hypothetical protein